MQSEKPRDGFVLEKDREGQEQRGPDRPEPALVSATDAAHRLGVSARAVRKRIAAGTLRGQMIDGMWFVHLGPEPVVAPEQGLPEAELRNRPWATPRVPPSSAPFPAQGQAAVAVMEQWIAPLATRIEELARENGALTANLQQVTREREVMERERDALRNERDSLAGQIAVLETPQKHVDTPPKGFQGESVLVHLRSEERRPQRSWWRMLLGWDSDEIA